MSRMLSIEAVELNDDGLDVEEIVLASADIRYSGITLGSSSFETGNTPIGNYYPN